LRNSGVPAVVVLACRVPAGLVTLGLFTLCGQSLRRVPPPALAGDGSSVGLCHPTPSVPLSARSFLRVLHCICFRTTGIPLCCSSWAVSSLYLPKTVLAALASLCPFPVTALPSSPAYTYLKNSICSPCKSSIRRFGLVRGLCSRRKNFSFTET
jgi:hypothetical protein